MKLLFGPTLLWRQIKVEPAPEEFEESGLTDVVFLGEYRYHIDGAIVFRTSDLGKGAMSEVNGREEIIDAYGQPRYLELLGLRRY